MSTPPSSSAFEIAALDERLSRDPWQTPERVIAHLGLRGDEAVVDLGAGLGYFTWPLAEVLPRGQVRALEIDAGLRSGLEAEAQRRNASRVAVSAASQERADLLFACNMLRAVTLAGLAGHPTRPSRLVVIDFMADGRQAGDVPPRTSRIPKERVIAELEGLFFLESSVALPRQYLLAFRRRP